MKDDYFGELLDGFGVVEREIEFHGRKKKTYWKPLTGAERVKLLEGQIVTRSVSDTDDVDDNRMSINLAQLTQRNHQLVFYTLVREDGTRAYDKIDQLSALPDALLSRLIETARLVQGGIDDPEKF